MTSTWQRFRQVTEFIPSGHKLYRSSAPNYPIQDLTAVSVQFLTSKGIDSVISFAETPYTSEALQLLDDAKIDYIHLSVVDFSAPTLAQLSAANDFFLRHDTTLVHCGYGHGRTGTGVTALQLYATKGTAPVQMDWSAKNYVETVDQIKVLENLRDSF